MKVNYEAIEKKHKNGKLKHVIFKRKIIKALIGILKNLMPGKGDSILCTFPSLACPALPVVMPR